MQTLIIDLGEDGCQLIENYVGKCILMEMIPYESDGGKDDGYDDDDRWSGWQWLTMKMTKMMMLMTSNDDVND